MMQNVMASCGVLQLYDIHAGPSAWNALPPDIRAVGDMKAFRQAVKTHY